MDGLWYLRCWCCAGNPLSFEPALNTFNDTALDAADFALYTGGSLGIKFIVPLVDNYHYYHGGKHDFTDWLGVPESEFYTNDTVIAAFKQYVFHRLNHTNRYSGLQAKDDPAILAWETGATVELASNA
jgi:endo-1,4-beta-mannosidase